MNKLLLARAVLASFKRIDQERDSYCIHCKKDFVYWGRHEPGCIVKLAQEIVDKAEKK